MHELPITESILEIAQRHAARAGAARVSDIHLVIGELTSFIDESIQFYWDMVSEGTIAERARLHFRHVPARMRCETCETDFEPGRDQLLCPQCEGSQVRVMAGNEFLVEAIEVQGAAGP